MTVAVLNLNFVNLPSYKLLICMEISLKVKSKMELLYRNIKFVLHQNHTLNTRFSVSCVQVGDSTKGTVNFHQFFRYVSAQHF